jgi:alpha-L-arabinofuranosidase
MQFMEPLGSTDGSVEAGWDFQTHTWRADLLEAARQLSPTLLRWPGGILSAYYRWREGIGPRHQRVPLLNLFWGGLETNQVGTHEFIAFCRAVGADPLIAVNFEADGKARFAQHGARSAGPDEAAEWVAYCNDPDHAERQAHGARDPFNVRLWQIGNETSYGPDGYDSAATARRTAAFAQAMRRADPSIQLIGWGDDGRARALLDVAGEHLDYVAVHHHFNSGLEGSPLRWNDYRVDPGWTWQHLMHAHHSTDRKLQAVRQELNGTPIALALTESHFGLPGRNRCDVLATWAAGVANARILNTHARHGDRLKIATLADFFGTRWMTNAILLPTPPGGAPAYLMPVAHVMALFSRHRGTQAVAVETAPDGLDVTASRADDRLFLHVVNTHLARGQLARLAVRGRQIESVTIHEIAPDPWEEVSPETAGDFQPLTHTLPPGETEWRFAPASVSAVEIALAPHAG